LGEPSARAEGIFAQNRNNITIKNGTVRGFFNGITLVDGVAHTIEGVRAELNTASGINIVRGNRSIIRNSRVVTGERLGVVGDTHGIAVSGNSTQVLDNDVINTVARGAGVSAVGIQVIGLGDGTVVENNRISNFELPETGTSIGIQVFADDVLVINNRIARMTDGIVYRASRKFRDTLTSGVTTPFFGGTNAGNNN
jgi:Right handed beta helix region